MRASPPPARDADGDGARGASAAATAPAPVAEERQQHSTNPAKLETEALHSEAESSGDETMKAHKKAGDRSRRDTRAKNRDQRGPRTDGDEREDLDEEEKDEAKGEADTVESIESITTFIEMLKPLDDAEERRDLVDKLSADALLEIIDRDDEELVCKLAVDEDVYDALRGRAGYLAGVGELVPAGSKRENRDQSKSLAQCLRHARENVKSLWQHFALNPPIIDCGGEEESVTPLSKTRRTSASQDSVSTVRSGPATTTMPSFFLPAKIVEWELHEDENFKAAVSLFKRTTAGVVQGAVPAYARDTRVVRVFEESQVHQFTLSLVKSVATNGLKQVIDEYNPEPDKRGPGFGTVDEIWPSSETRIYFAGFQAPKRVDIEISAQDSALHLEAFEVSSKRARDFRERGDRSQQAEYDAAADKDGVDRRLALLNDNVAMIECKRIRTLKDHEPLTVGPDLMQAAARAERPTRVSKEEREMYFGSTNEPIAQLCMYLVGTGIRYGALTDGARTFFVYRCPESRTIKATDAFFSNDGENQNPDGLIISQVWLAFLHCAILDRPSAPRSIDLDWLKDEKTEPIINLIEKGEIKIETSHAVRVQPGEDGVYRLPQIVFTNNTGVCSQPPVRLATVLIGPNMIRDGMARVLGGAGTGYPGIEVNGAPSYLKTTYSLRESGDALFYEGCVYAKLQHLQGDAIPEVTAFGKDPRLELTALATKQSGVSLAHVPFDAYGGARALYYKAAAALVKIHGAGFTHGDVALRNIVVDDNEGESREDPVVRFIDLERARETDSEIRREEELDTLAELFGITPEEDVRAFAPGNNNCAQTKPCSSFNLD